MPKSHTVKLKIVNNTGFKMKPSGDWFDSGRLADDYSWPEVSDKDHETVVCYERDWAMAGCSGLVVYNLIDGNQEVGSMTIAFSNPDMGNNKVGVGAGTDRSSDNQIWSDMGDHGYNPFTQDFSTGGRSFVATCECSGGSTNNASVTLARR